MTLYGDINWDINPETDSNPEPRETSNFRNHTLPIWEAPDRDDWNHGLQRLSNAGTGTDQGPSPRMTPSSTSRLEPVTSIY